MMNQPGTASPLEEKVYEMYGLKMRSEIPLGIASEPFDRLVDLTIRLSRDTAETGDDADWETLAAVEFANGRGYEFKRGSQGHVLRFFDECEFRFDQDLRRCEASMRQGRPVEVAEWLLKASVPALLLGLRGEPMLHASAFEVDGEAYAVTGDSGMGKSTLAALFCSAGRRLVSDDLLRLAFVNDGATCFPGGRELRLRGGNAGPGCLFGEEKLHTALDGRLIATCQAVRGALPLAAVLIPKPDREAHGVRARLLSKSEAAYCLNLWPRVAGWRIEKPKRAHFENMAQLVRRVPVVEVEMPVGPPFARDLPDQILLAMARVLN